MNNFVNTPNFDRLVTAGTVQVIPNTGLWYPVFRSQDDAVAFGLYVAAAIRRIVPTSGTHVSVHRLPTGFAATCYVGLPGYGYESGLLVCSGGNGLGFGGIVAGVYLTEVNCRVLFPLKRPRYVAETESGTSYLGFVDGTAYARSKSDGPVDCAPELCFAPDHGQAKVVFEKGGTIAVHDVPGVGMTPMYGASKVRTPGWRQFTARSFRRGTPVKRVHVFG